MVNKGHVQIGTVIEVSDMIADVKRDIEQRLTQIENLNESFIRNAKDVSENGFTGEFSDKFKEELEKEQRFIRNLYGDNIDSLRNFANRYGQFLDEISGQSYVYETELIPVKPNQRK